MKILKALSPLILLCLSLVAFQPVIFAQGQQPPPTNYPGEGYIEDDSDSLWLDDGFIEDLGLDGESNIEETDPEAGTGDYINEEEVPDNEAAAVLNDTRVKDIGAALDESKQLMTLNLIYGAGTGGVIGGWLFYITDGTSRVKMQYLGTSIVGGILLGLAIGTKAVYTEPLPTVGTARYSNQDSKENIQFAITPTIGKNGEPGTAFQFSLNF